MPLTVNDIVLKKCNLIDGTVVKKIDVVEDGFRTTVWTNEENVNLPLIVDYEGDETASSNNVVTRTHEVSYVVDDYTTISDITISREFDQNYKFNNIHIMLSLYRDNQLIEDFVDITYYPDSVYDEPLREYIRDIPYTELQDGDVLIFKMECVLVAIQSSTNAVDCTFKLSYE